MISPTGNQRNPYNYFRRQRSNSQISFASLLVKSAGAGAAGTQIQRSSLVFGAKEEPVEPAPFEIPSWMGRAEDMKYYELDEGEPIRVIRPDPTYPESVYDIPPVELMAVLSAAMDTVADMDFSGKEKTEIYNEVTAIYESYLGKDFLEPSQTWSYKNLLDQQQQTWIGMEYHNSLLKKGVDLGVERVLREVKGYDLMTDEEIKAAVRGKYPKEMTLAQCLIMAKELDALGAEKAPGNESYFMKILGGIGLSLGTQGMSEQFRRVYAALLELPADYDAIKARYAEHMENDYTSEFSTSIDDAFEKLLPWVGGNAGTHGEILTLMREMMANGELRINNEGYLWFMDFPR